MRKHQIPATHGRAACGSTAGWESSSNKLHAPPYSLCPPFPPSHHSFLPCGALAIPIYLFLLPTKGKALAEYALCCWGLSGMLDSAFFFLTHSFHRLRLLSLTVFICPLFSALPLPPLALCSTLRQPGGQIGAWLS